MLSLRLRHGAEVVQDDGPGLCLGAGLGLAGYHAGVPVAQLVQVGVVGEPVEWRLWSLLAHQILSGWDVGVGAPQGKGALGS